MFRDKKLLEKRYDYVMKYINDNQSKKMGVIVEELSNSLFLTERTIYAIIDKANGPKRIKK